MRFVVKYSFGQRLISFSENVNDQQNAISTVSVTFASSQEAAMRGRCCAEVRPDHAGDQYVSFTIIVARKTSVSDVAGSPWLRRTRIRRIAYYELEHEANSELTWSAAVSLSFNTTPSAVRLSTWLMPRQGAPGAGSATDYFECHDLCSNLARSRRIYI